jgi:hypothetical protein
MGLALVDIAYLEAVSGRAYADQAARATTLVDIASRLVREAARRPELTGENAPEAARLAVARLVIAALDQDAEQDAVRAEQIGDYRVEFQRRSDLPGRLDLSLVDDLIDDLRPRARSVRAGTPIEGTGGNGRFRRGWSTDVFDPEHGDYVRPVDGGAL